MLETNHLFLILNSYFTFLVFKEFVYLQDHENIVCKIKQKEERTE